MSKAFEQAKTAYIKGEVPVGAVIVLDGRIIGTGHNQVIQNNSVSAHAEIIAIEMAGKHQSNYRLPEAIMYSTLEPCHMCAKAIIDARIKTLFFGAFEPKTGSLASIDNFFEKPHLNHFVEIKCGLMEKESRNLMQKFFLEKRLKS